MKCKIYVPNMCRLKNNLYLSENYLEDQFIDNSGNLITGLGSLINNGAGDLMMKHYYFY